MTDLEVFAEEFETFIGGEQGVTEALGAVLAHFESTKPPIADVMACWVSR